MSLSYCPYCGVRLTEMTFGRMYCPNHGIVEGLEKAIGEEDDKYKSYID